MLADNKSISELHLRQPRFTYIACGPFTKHSEIIQKFRATGNLNQIYKNESNKACFAHDAAYSESKNLANRTIPDKILKERVWSINFMTKKQDWEENSVINKFKRRKVYARFKDSIQ